MICLEESQIKNLLSQKGIPVPKGFLVREGNLPKEAPGGGDGDWVLKAQVPFGSRHKKGLVCFTSSNDFMANCRDLFRKMKGYGSYGKILAEEKILHGASYYAAIASDPVTRGPLLLFSVAGGVDVENVLSERKGLFTKDISILKGLQESDVHGLLAEAGILERPLIQKITQACMKLYELYREWQCRFIEINPLVEAGGSLCALDAKMELDEDALFRIEAKMKELGVEDAVVSNTLLEKEAGLIDQYDYRGSAHFVQTDVPLMLKKYGSRIKAFIGFNGVGTGASLTAMDELVRLGFFPRNFCDTSGNPPASKLYRMTKIILSQDNIQGYFFLSCLSSQQLHHTARGIIKAFKELYSGNGGVPPVPVLLLFRGAWDEEARSLFEEHGMGSSESVLILGRETTEREAACRFAELYEKIGQSAQRIVRV